MREEKRDETLDKIKRMIVKEENIFYLHFILELIKELLIHAKRVKIYLPVHTHRIHTHKFILIYYPRDMIDQPPFKTTRYVHVSNGSFCRPTGKIDWIYGSDNCSW